MAENFRRCIGFIHVIEKGDTLYKLGKKYGGYGICADVRKSLCECIQSSNWR